MKPGTVVLRDDANASWLCHENPVHVVSAHRLDEVAPCLARVESLGESEGLHAAGFISYEASPAFDPAQATREPGPLPLLWFGLYDKPRVIDLPPIDGRPSNVPADWEATVDRGEYARAIAAIKEHIGAGETYQVNYTFRLRSPFSDDPWEMFAHLMACQRTIHAAYVDTGRHVVCSASPELFLELAGDTLRSRPMKGTAARGRTLAEDTAHADWLHHSEKNRAENVMIVDMIRNDMGRVADAGTVHVPSLFDVERYPTVWQMTSLVEARTKRSATDILTALFPCASITGAPKCRTMEIIAELETTPRGVYCGAVGHISPGRRMRFNVAIRTVCVDRERRSAEYGVGGGVLWYSETADEFEECKTKARVLRERRPEFSLLETLLWRPEEGFFLEGYHLDRLLESAEYFQTPITRDAVRDVLERAAAGLPALPHRIRLLVDRDGRATTEAYRLGSMPNPVRLVLAREPVDSRNPFLYHKTTNRGVYDSPRASAKEADDVLLYNERGEITETTIANVVARLDGRLVTPPVSCGLLAGTFRRWLLDRGEVEEAVIRTDDLARATELFVVNSVRGMLAAMLDTTRG
ncbi:MAG: aminodeoxychorismate synthase component I [Desulfatibacillaceae bacterium]